MKLADLATGSDVIVWIVFGIFAVISIILLSGHGSWFISGYNTASKEEKEKYDEKKLCRTMGIGMSIIAILVLTMGLLENILPASFVYIALGIILVDVVVIIILGNRDSNILDLASTTTKPHSNTRQSHRQNQLRSSRRE